MDGKVVIGTSLDTKSFDKEIALLESKLNDLEASLQMASEDKTLFSTSEIREMEAEVEKLSNKLIDLKKKQATANGLDFSKIEGQLKNIGNSLSKTVTKVAKWGLALIGIRSVYSGIRRAISLVSAENEGIATQIDVMRSAIANALLPLAQTILNILAKIMVYMNYIYNVVTGKNLFDFDKAFSNVSKNAKNTAKSMGGVSKSAKEIRKTLAGFDEMNILNDNVSATGGGGGASGIGNLDKIQLKNPFENWQNFKIPTWIEKLGNLVKWAANNWEDFAGMVTLAGVALGVITGNPMMAIISFIGYLIVEIPKLVDGIKILTGSNSLLEAGLKVLAFGIIPAVIDGYIDLTTETGSVTQATINLKNAKKNLKNMEIELSNATNSYKVALENAKNAQKELEKAEKETGLSGEALFKQVQNGTLSYKDMNVQQKRVYEAYLVNMDAQKQKETATKKLTEAEKKEVEAKKEVEKATLTDALAKQRASKDYEEYKKTVVDAYNKGQISAGEARDYIEQACQDMSDANAKTFTKDLPNDVKTGLDPNKYKTTLSKFKNAWNTFMDGLKTKLGITVDTSKVKSGSGGGGGGAFAKGGIVYSKLPRLAPGGIINQPGRGVPLGSAIGGERGQEGVIPLTDSQQMALLGEAIGKYITVNANIVTTMNGRVISKELQRVQNESDFAYNR